jgi:hypothetical protein
MGDEAWLLLGNDECKGHQEEARYQASRVPMDYTVVSICLLA